MRQFSLTQLLMFVALVAILLTLVRSEGCRSRNSAIWSLEFASDGKNLLVARYDGHAVDSSGTHFQGEVCRTISVIDVDAGLPKMVVDQVAKSSGLFILDRVNRLPCTAFAEGEEAVLIDAPESGELRCFDLAGGQSRTLFGGYKQRSRGFIVSRDRSVVAIGYDDAVVLCDARSGHQLGRIPGGPCSNCLLSLSADGEYLLSLGTLEYNRLWNVCDGKESAISRDIDPISFSAIGHTLVSLKDARIRLFGVDGKLSRELPCKSTIWWDKIAFSADESKLAAATTDAVMLMDCHTGQMLGQIPAAGLSAFALSPDGNYIAIGDYRGGLTLWRPGSEDAPKQIVVPGRTNIYTWHWPFVALVIWASICYWIWVRRKWARQPQARPSAASSASS